MATQVAPSKAIISSVGGIGNGGSENSTKPAIIGTADANVTVNIYDGVRLLGTAIASSTGAWTFTPSADIKLGKHSFTAIAVSSTGTYGVSSEPVSVTVSSSAPAKPVVSGLTDDTGHAISSPSNDPRPNMSGTGTPTDIITMYDGSTPIASTTVNSDGTWSLKPTSDLPSGTNDIYVIETPAGGGTGTPSDHYPVIIDTHVPATPAAPVLKDDSGAAIAAGSTSSDAHPNFSGTGTAGDIIKVYDGSNVIGSVKIGPDGTWSFKPTTDLSNGTHDLYVTETTPAGTASAASPHYPITVDTATPAKPVISGLTDDSGVAIGAGTMTTDAHPTMNGTGKTGDTVTLYDNGVAVGSVKITSADGTWSLKPSVDLTGASHDLYVIETSPAGVASPQSDHIAITYGGSGSAQIIITGIYDSNGHLVAPGETTSGPLTVTGWLANPGTTNTALLFVTNGDAHGATVQGRPTINGNNFSMVLSPDLLLNGVAYLVPGDVTVYAKYSDAAGVAQLSTGYTVTDVNWTGAAVAAPNPPVITDVVGVDGNVTGHIANGGTVSDSKPTISGTGHSGDVIKVFDGATLLGSTSVGIDGTWSFKPATALANAATHTLTATETNAVGSSGSSAGYAINVDTTSFGGAHIVITAIYDSVGNLIPNGGTTSGAITVVGWLQNPASDPKAKPFLNYTTSDGVSHQATTGVLATINGSYFSMTINSGNMDMQMYANTSPFTVLMRYVDATGNSYTSAGYVVTNANFAAVIVPPVIPVITDVVANGGSLSGHVASGGSSSDAKPTVSGTGHVGDLIKIYDASTLIGSTVVGNGGTWSFMPPTALAANATHSLTATATNAVATTAASAPYSIFVDTSIAYGGAQILITGVYDSSGHLVPSGGTTSGALTVTGWMANPGDASASTLYLTSVVNSNVSRPNSALKFDGHNFSFVLNASSIGSAGLANPNGQITIQAGGKDANGVMQLSGIYNVTDTNWSAAALKSTLSQSLDSVHDDGSTAAVATDSQDSSAALVEHHTAVGANDTFVGHGTYAHETVDLNVDPIAYFNQGTAHIEGAKGVSIDTLHLTGDHQVLDLTSLTGQTAAAKISGIEVVDLGGHTNTVKLSLVDVLNLGETDLFQTDGKQQMMVKGSAGDSVDLSNSHIAGLAEGEWQAHGTTQVGGVTYNVYEHSGVHTELLVQQGVQIVVH